MPEKATATHAVVNGYQEMKGPAVPARVSRNPNQLHDEKLTFGQRAADSMAKRAGSWSFIFGFIFVLVVWIALNSLAYIRNWDPYPFILLNLLLSCLAAIQAPVIMMSQNRQESRDRLEANLDFAVNVKAEKELELLQRKLDWINSVRLKEISDAQAEMSRLLKDLAAGNQPSR